MEQLTEEAKRMLDALKAEETPGAAAGDRMWAGVLARGGGAGAGGVGAGKLLAALGVGAAVAITLAVAWPRGDAGPAAVAPAPTPTPTPVSDDPPLVPRVRDGAVPGASLSAPPASPSDEPAPPAEVRPPARRPGTKAQVGSEAEGADLERELALLGQAKTRLRSQDPGRALGLLDEHRRAFPRSSFGEERDLLRIDALCRLGRVDEGRAETRRFLARHPGSALADQARDRCGGG